MKRHEMMKQMFEAIKDAEQSYTDGLTLDYECLNTLMDMVSPVYMKLTCCTVCGSGENAMGPAIASPEGYVPCCKNCYAKTKAVYLCVWGLGYVNHSDLDGAKQANNSLDFFTRENGYDQISIEAVKALEVGESCCLNDVTAIHTVVRVK